MRCDLCLVHVDVAPSVAFMSSDIDAMSVIRIPLSSLASESASLLQVTLRPMTLC